MHKVKEQIQILINSPHLQVVITFIVNHTLITKIMLNNLFIVAIQV